MPTANENIRDSLLQRSIYLDHYATGLQQQITQLLDSSEPAVRSEIERRLGIIAAGNGQYVFDASTNAQLATLANNLLKTRGDAINNGFDKLGSDLSTLGQHEADHTDAVFNQQSPVTLDTVLPNSTQLAAIATSTPFQGRILSQWATTLAAADVQRMMDTVTVGMAQGLSTDKIVRDVLGTNLLNGADGVTQQTRRDAASIVQTAVSTTANEARGAWTDANSDVVGDEVWVATLDGSTCPECMALDGQHFAVGEGEQPPAHFNCRCVRVPTLDGSLIGDRPATSATEDQLAGLSDDERAAKVSELTGQVPASMSYQEWLAQQSPDFQDEVLGPQRAAMFRDNNLPLSRFVNQNGDTLTLDELRQKGPASLFVAGDTTTESLSDALGSVDSAKQMAVFDANQQVNDLLGIDGTQRNVVGAWPDRAENSIAMNVPSGTDYETLRAAAAMKGTLGDQQSVLLFQAGPGADSLSHFTLDGSVADVHQQLLDAGIQKQTLEPLTDGRVGVTIFNTDQSGLDAVKAFGDSNGINIDTNFGRGEFVGSPLAGSDTPASVVRADASNQFNNVINAYLKDQPDDVQAGWQRVLADWNSTKTTLPGIQAADVKTADLVKAGWIANSPVKTVDDLFTNATRNDAYIKSVAADVEAKTGAIYKPGPIKEMGRTLEKLGTANPASITDVVRGTFVVDSPAQADSVVAALGQRLPVADENWRFLKSGYFDRTTKVLLPDGTIAEVQLAPQSLIDAKFGQGHGLYEQFRTLESKGLADTPEAQALNQQMVDLYTNARANVPPAFRDALAQMEAASRG